MNPSPVLLEHHCFACGFCYHPCRNILASNQILSRIHRPSKGDPQDFSTIRNRISHTDGRVVSNCCVGIGVCHALELRHCHFHQSCGPEFIQVCGSAGVGNDLSTGMACDYRNVCLGNSHHTRCRILSSHSLVVASDSRLCHSSRRRANVWRIGKSSFIVSFFFFFFFFFHLQTTGHFFLKMIFENKSGIRFKDVFSRWTWQWYVYTSPEWSCCPQASSEFDHLCSNFELMISLASPFWE